MNILITGGCGFIGSILIKYLMRETPCNVINLDALTYAANPQSLAQYKDSTRYTFIEGNILDAALVESVLKKHSINAVVHLAAESHVDRSIESVMPFAQTNVIGTVTLLDVALKYWRSLNESERDTFRFHHVSTDEVYGSLGVHGQFTEMTPYDPRSPYSASKAASDHFASAFWHTYKLPIVITNCSNNYGPHQFPEKLIPLTILKCLQEEKIPVYGQGTNIRDWLFVEDHAKAIYKVLTQGTVGETYNIGGDAERENIQVVETICGIMDNKLPRKAASYKDLIIFVEDRPGHDLRYAIDHQKITDALGWNPEVTFEEGIESTIDWYLNNQEWLKTITATTYNGKRLGLK